MPPIIIACVAALSFGSYSVFMNLSAGHINRVFGAMMVSVVGAAIGLIALLLIPRNGEHLFDSKGMVFITLTGATVFLTEYLVLYIYEKGMSVAVGSTIVVGGGLAFSVAVGLLMGEPFSLIKALGVGCVLLGVVLLGLAS
jgi:drug/metabolite transporter (DMT)-like permease